MSSTTRPNRREKRSRMALQGAALSTVALMLASGITPAQCFGTKEAVSNRRISTRRNFHSSVDAPFKVDEVTSSFDATNIFLPTSAAESTHASMPTWLKNTHGHSYESNWNILRETMTNSFYTTNEIQRLHVAIRQASVGDREMMSGAAEFCLILVETMEMGLNALIAAVFHYCSCVTARKRSLLLPPKFSSSVWDWDGYDHNGLEGFGKHAFLIARDAGRLKKLEMVADKIMQTSSEAHRQRFTPNSQDSENLKNLLVTEAEDWQALAIRCAASLYRLRGILKNGSTELKPESVRASREAFHIYAPLASRLGMHRLKNELEGTAFKILYRRQYEAVNTLAREVRGNNNEQGASNSKTVKSGSLTSVDIGESMKQLLANVQEDMTEMLQNDVEFSNLADSFSVMARVKEPYSMWKKMLRNKSKHILQVPDAVALRIVLDAKKLTTDEPKPVTKAREKLLCYYAQRLCKERWAPLPGNPRFKDYIGNPKPNGYQSLHYTATASWAGEEWPLEIQVRTSEMHKIAEFGGASHWEYKARQNSKGSSVESLGQSSNAFVRPVEESYSRRSADAITKWDASLELLETVALSDEAQIKVRAERIRERTKRLEPYLEALTVARSDLARENVYVFLSRDESSEGNVLSLPAGSSVSDALREAERQLPVSMPWTADMALVSRNGSAATSTTILTNGDVLEIRNSGGNFQ